MSTKQQNKKNTNKNTNKNSNVDNTNNVDNIETSQQQNKKQTTTKPNSNKQTKKPTDQTSKEQKPKSQPLPKTQEIIGIINGGALKGSEVIVFKDNGTYGISQFYNKLKTFYEFGVITPSKFNCYYYPVSNCNAIYNQFIERCKKSQEITDLMNDEEKKNIINYKIIEDNDNIFNGMILIHCKNCTYIKSIIKELTGGIVIKSFPEVIRISKPRQSNTNKQSPPKKSTSSKNNIIEDDNTTDDPKLKANITKNSKRKQVIKNTDENEDNEDNENNGDNGDKGDNDEQADSDEADQIQDNEEENDGENDGENVEEDDD